MGVSPGATGDEGERSPRIYPWGVVTNDLKHWSLKHGIDSLQAELDEWPFYCDSRSEEQQAMSLMAMEAVLALLTRITPLLAPDTRKSDLSTWAAVISDSRLLVWAVGQEHKRNVYPESLKNIRHILASLPKVSAATQIDRFQAWIKARNSPDHGDLLRGAERLAKAAKEWKELPESIAPPSRRSRGDFLLNEMDDACQVMTRSKCLTRSAKAYDQMTTTMNQVAALLEDTLTTTRVNDETGFLLRLSALHAQATV